MFVIKSLNYMGQLRKRFVFLAQVALSVVRHYVSVLSQWTCRLDMDARIL